MRNKKLILASLGVVGLAVGAWLAFGFFGVQTLFIDDVVDEASEFSEGEATTDSSGNFVALGRYSGQGEALVLSSGDQRSLRFENFEVSNGPDLKVYLVANASADSDKDLFDDDFISLGELSGNIGNQNYELSSDIDIEQYNTVVIWCERFSTPFAAADLA